MPTAVFLTWYVLRMEFAGRSVAEALAKEGWILGGRAIGPARRILRIQTVEALRVEG